MLNLRIATGAVGVPVMLALVAAGGAWFYTLVLFGAIVGTLELLTIVQFAGHRPLLPIGLALAAAFVAAAALPNAGILPVALAMAAVATPMVLMVRPNSSGALADWSLTLAPALYVGGLLHFSVLLRDSSDGLFWVLTTLIATWVGDTAAFFAGRAFGRTKLAPRVSPGKTVEGAVAGVASAVLVAVVAGQIAGLPLARLAGLGLTVGIGAVLGDLVESFFKRQCGVKDSGALLPGHGGILDRIDGLILAAAGAYLYVVMT